MGALAPVIYAFQAPRGAMPITAEQAHAMVVLRPRQRRPLMVILRLWMHISWRNGGLKLVTIDRYLVTIRPDKRHGTCVVLISSLLDE